MALVKQSSQLDKEKIANLCRIKVIRGGGRMGAGSNKRKTRIANLGNETWIVGVRELKQDPKPDEQELIDEATRTLRERTGVDDDDFDWIKWGVRGRFPRDCRQGDTVIEVWRSSDGKRPSRVVKTPVLLKQSTKAWTRFYTGRTQQIGWGQFQRLLRKIGYARKVKPGSVQLVEPDVADAISRNWKAATKG